MHLSTMALYDINAIELKEKIKNSGYRKLLLQFPEGLFTHATEIADLLEDEAYEIFISSTPTYGACDIEVRPDYLTIQFGHSEIPNINYPENLLFAELSSDEKFDKVTEIFATKIECDRVGIVASVQHVPRIKEVVKIIETHGKTALVGKGDYRIKYPGQVLGCNFSTARDIDMDVDCFVFMGTGMFHAIGVRIATGRRTYVLDPYANRIIDVEPEADRFMRQRFGAIVRAEEAERFGIIIGAKIGQRREKLANALISMIKDAGKKGYFIYSDFVNPENFYFDVDVFVNTSCPRITYDDYLRFPKPVISPVELQIALKYRIWENFKFDEIVEVD